MRNPPQWFFSPGSSKWALVFLGLWGVGDAMIIFLAGLLNIPRQLYEAADIEGASSWKKFRYITLPLLTPSLFFVVVISLINGFQVFDQVWVMTGGGPAGSSTVVVEQIVKNTFSYGRAGYASAQSMVLFAIILIVTAMQVRLQKRWVFYG